MATDRRILELALKGLEAERARVDEEIAEIRVRLEGSAQPAAKKTARKKRRRRKMSAAQRKAISERMKKTWAARRKKKQ